MGLIVNQLQEKWKKQFREDILFKGLHYKTCKRIPFSSPRLNYMTYGGVVRGTINEFLGEEGSGKTTTALDLAKNAQAIFKEEYEEVLKELEAKRKNLKNKNELKALETLIAKHQEKGPKLVAYFDIENSIEKSWTKTLGVNIDEMLYIPARVGEYAEETFEKMIELAATEEIGLMVLDSVGQLLSKKEQEETMEDKQYGGIASPLTKFCKKIDPILKVFDCTLIAINQKRDDINNPFNRYKTPGGRNFKHSCALRMSFNKGDKFDKNLEKVKKSSETPFGHYVEVDLPKNKKSPNDRQCGFYTLTYRNGIDAYNDFIDVAMRCEIIIQSGAWFNILEPDTKAIMQDADGNELKFQGRPALVKYLKENDVVYKDLSKAVENTAYRMDD